MTDQELESRVCAAIAKGTAVPVEQVTLDATFDSLNLQSLDFALIIFALEEEFGIQIAPEDFEIEAAVEDAGNRRIADIVILMKKVLADNAPSP